MNYYPDDVIDEAIRLYYDRGEDVTAIAMRLEIPRSTLSNLLKNPHAYRISSKKPFQPRVEPSANTGPYRRCRTCGHDVQMPCRICNIREYKRLQKLKMK